MDRPAGAHGSVSHALFNNAAFADAAVSAHRLLAAGGDDASVTTRKVAAATGRGDSVVRPVMWRLADAGLLEPLAKQGPPNSPQYFRRGSAQLWTVLLALIAEATGTPLDVIGEVDKPR